MTRDEQDALEALERAATQKDAHPHLWALVTRHRAGEPLAAVLAEAIDLLTDPEVSGGPSEEVLEQARDAAREAERYADRAEEAASDARDAADEANEALGLLLKRARR